ncbi:MAG: DUF4956 domain-containing protein [Proteobacteria bacterium]|nr:DUF4956 domain-containing protein [Pseudomonadota bacterium]
MFDFLINNTGGLWLFLAGFTINFVIVYIIVRFFYFPKSQRRDYFFTYILMSISIFLLIFILNDVKFKTGFALGLFAIFSIIRYRTDSMPVREMTYLFAVIAISVINAVIGGVPWQITIGANILMIASIAIVEAVRGRQVVANKLIMYDRIDLIKEDKRAEMIEDLKSRTGLDIVSVEVGHVDFLKDSAMLKVHYRSNGGCENSVDRTVKFPKPEEDNDD